MKHLLKICILLLSLLPLQLAVAQSTNGNGDSQGRENWFPNRGNVGIGTRSPSEALEVLGSVRVSQTVFTNDMEAVGLKANTLAVAQDASIGANLLVNGNVGIGVSNPSERLEIAGSLKASAGLYSDFIDTGDGRFSRNVQITQDLIVNGKTGLGVSAPSERLDVLGNVKVSESVFSNSIESGSGLFRENLHGNQNIIADGSIGIGTTNPAEKLDVVGNIRSTGDVLAVNVRADKGFFSSLESDGNLSINGNVGIGVTSPVEKLEIAGNIKATGALLSTSAQISQDITAGGNATINGKVGIGIAPGADHLTVGGSAYFQGLLTAENITVKQKLDLKGTFSVAGTLGVGVATPEAALHVNGDGKFDGDIRANKIIVNAIEIAGATQDPEGGSSVSLGDNLFVNGSMGIGTNKVEGFRLSVDGKIRAGDDIQVYSSAEWSDFVLDEDYKLLSLSEVEAYIKRNGHLPSIPSAEEVAKEGVNLVEMDAKLLQKIEELTLYVIEMKKENEALKNEVDSLKSSRHK